MGLSMNDRDLEKMGLDDLWSLHERLIEVLDRKLEDEKQRLQNRLDSLGRRFGGSPKDLPQRRPYPKVEPKFRNPNDPSETVVGTRKTSAVGRRVACGRKKPRRDQDPMSG